MSPWLLDTRILGFHLPRTAIGIVTVHILWWFFGVADISCFELHSGRLTLCWWSCGSFTWMKPVAVVGVVVCTAVAIFYWILVVCINRLLTWVASVYMAANSNACDSFMLWAHCSNPLNIATNIFCQDCCLGDASIVGYGTPVCPDPKGWLVSMISVELICVV